MDDRLPHIAGYICICVCVFISRAQLSIIKFNHAAFRTLNNELCVVKKYLRAH